MRCGEAFLACAALGQLCCSHMVPTATYDQILQNLLKTLSSCSNGRGHCKTVHLFSLQ